MAKKKVVTTMEEEVVEDAPQVPEEYADIHNKGIREIAAEELPKNEDEAPEEIPQPEIAPEPKVEEKPAFDPDKFQEETADKITDKIVNALKGKDNEETKENVNAYQKLVQDVWQKEQRTPSWDEVLPLIEEAAVQRIETKQQEAYQKQQEEVKAQQQVQDNYLSNVNTLIEEELQELYQNNKLPKIKDDKNPDDPGIQARDALFQTMAKVNKERVDKGMHPIVSLSRIHNSYYKAPNRQPAGADAAIINNRGGASDEGEQELNYFKDVHNKGWRSFFKRK